MIGIKIKNWDQLQTSPYLLTTNLEEEVMRNCQLIINHKFLLHTILSMVTLTGEFIWYCFDGTKPSQGYNTKDKAKLWLNFWRTNFLLHKHFYSLYVFSYGTSEFKPNCIPALWTLIFVQLLYAQFFDKVIDLSFKCIRICI